MSASPDLPTPTVVFLGPTMPVEDARGLLSGATYLPPARRGDIVAAVRDHGAETIALIDGHFEQVPSVWHKEILWALDRGVAIWGASSMGALRASELRAFGMRGVGRIYEAYASGRFAPFPEPFEDDDEVAVVHGPEDAAYLSTDAMVDIRATLAAAEAAGVLTRAERDAFAACAKALFYKRRTFAAMLGEAERRQMPAAAIRELRAWLPVGRVPLKRRDAESLLKTLARATPAAPRPVFHFERTLVWTRAGLEPVADAETGLSGEFA